MASSRDAAEVPAAWVFEIDPREVDLTEAFAGGEAVLEFEVDGPLVEALGPGQVAHLWVHDRRGDAVPAGIYATGSVVGPVRWIEEDGDRYPAVEVGLDPLASPIDGVALLAADAFVGSPLQAGMTGLDPGHGAVAPGNPVPLDGPQSAVVAANPLEPGRLSPLLSLDPDDRGPQEEEVVVLPALEVRLPADTLLVVDSEGRPGWTVVRGSPDAEDFEELPQEHRTFMDAVEYVASVAEQAAHQLPVVDLDEGIEAIAIFDAVGGVYVVVKEAPASYAFCWLADDGAFDRVDGYASLKEAILLPVLDEELFGGA